MTLRDRYGEETDLDDLAPVLPIRDTYWQPTPSGLKWIAHIKAQLTRDGNSDDKHE